MKKILLLLTIISIAIIILVQKTNQLEVVGKVESIKNFEESKIITLENEKEVLIMSKDEVRIKEKDKIKVIGTKLFEGKKEKIIANKIYRINDS